MKLYWKYFNKIEILIEIKLNKYKGVLNMKIKDIKVYEDWKANNTDFYGRGIFRYAEKWANLMEEQIKEGKFVKDIAKDLSTPMRELYPPDINL